MTNILAISGKKQSGKNTSFNYLLGIELLRLAVVREKIEIREDGKLFISDIFGDEQFRGIFDINRDNPAMERFRNENIYPIIRNYSFADILKKEICINLLGLTHSQCYGTDEEKNTPTHLLWENMPGVTTIKTPQDPVNEEVAGRLGVYYKKVLSGMVYHKPGPMTAREVMQFVGTEVFRKMYDKVWASGTINRIKQYGTKLAVITDCRFSDEVDAVQKAGGRVIRLTRSIPGENDSHWSETALDKENYDWDNFDLVIDNANMTISDQNEALYKALYGWGWFEGIELPEQAVAE